MRMRQQLFDVVKKCQKIDKSKKFRGLIKKIDKHYDRYNQSEDKAERAIEKIQDHILMVGHHFETPKE